MKTESFPCPVCGFLVFDEPSGSYNICPLCDWEDDHVQLAHPVLRGGANRSSLAEAQFEALKKFPIEVREHSGFRRDATWRPLREEEMKLEPDSPVDGRSYFEAVTVQPVYYWLKDRR